MDREYKIDASSRRCQACSHVFTVGEEYFSAVVETSQEDRLARQDFCPACWKPEGGGYFSFWRTRVPEPPPASDRGPRLVDLGRLMQLFEHLADAPDVPAQRFRYVLALVLMRKRRLRVLESRRLAGGRGEELTLREVGSQRQHLVSCPSITEDEIRSVADRLREILDMPERWDQVATGVAETAAPTEPAADLSAEASASAAYSAEAAASAAKAGKALADGSAKAEAAGDSAGPTDAPSPETNA